MKTAKPSEIKYRLMPDGTKRQEPGERVKIIIDTKCPKKWAFIDMEESKIYISNNGDGWLFPTNSDIFCIRRAERRNHGWEGIIARRKNAEEKTKANDKRSPKRKIVRSS